MTMQRHHRHVPQYSSTLPKMLTWFKKRNELKRSATSLYGAIVAQSRLPHFYAVSGVPDTVEGRFDVVVLHMFLVLERLKDEGDGVDLIYQLGDVFMDELDGSMREMGVGDLSVPKKMRLAAAGFLGRLEAYHAAMEQPDDAALVAALVRNVYAGSGPPAAAWLAAYARGSLAALRRQPFSKIMQGHVAFPSPSEALGHG
ncbi:MAG: ubiquinol-cytochrome C chaperone [Hyphomicrobiaceae bacterium]|nr:MAG: ubiquinol-cytochrome C chaperone [Hyphomicrobiaceae bacterium]